MKGKKRKRKGKTVDELFQSQMLTGLAGDVVGGFQKSRRQRPVSGKLAGQLLSVEDRLKVCHGSGLDSLTGGPLKNKIKHLQRLMSQLELRGPEWKSIGNVFSLQRRIRLFTKMVSFSWLRNHLLAKANKQLHKKKQLNNWSQLNVRKSSVTFDVTLFQPSGCGNLRSRLGAVRKSGLGSMWAGLNNLLLPDWVPHWSTVRQSGGTQTVSGCFLDHLVWWHYSGVLPELMHCAINRTLLINGWAPEILVPNYCTLRHGETADCTFTAEPRGNEAVIAVCFWLSELILTSSWSLLQSDNSILQSQNIYIFFLISALGFKFSQTPPGLNRIYFLSINLVFLHRRLKRGSLAPRLCLNLFIPCKHEYIFNK